MCPICYGILQIGGWQMGIRISGRAWRERGTHTVTFDIVIVVKLVRSCRICVKYCDTYIYMNICASHLLMVTESHLRCMRCI